MARPPAPDPLEFDPTSSEEPQARAPSQPGGAEARAGDPRQVGPEGDGSPIGDRTRVAPGPEPRPKGLRLDFSEVQGLEQEQRAASRTGAARIDEAGFLSRSDRAAMERARAVPRAGLPSLIERDERSAGIRVVHESRRFWLWLALGVAIPALLVTGAVAGLVRYRAAAMEREVDSLRKSDAIHRQLEEERQQQIAR